jgi:PAS domain S-box-containing protein
MNESVKNSKTYDSLLETIDAIVWEADAQTGQYRLISPQVETILGYTVQEWLAAPTFWQDHIHPDDAHVILQFWQKTAVQQPFQLEYRMQGKDGRYYWLRDHINVIVEGNQPVVLQGIKIDFTTHKQANILESERAEVLREFARIVGASLDHRQILHQTLHQLKRVLRFDSASIYLNHTDEHNEFVSGIGYEDEQMTNEASTGLLKHSPILAQMAKDLQPVICPDVRQLADWIWVPGAEHVRSFIGVPLINHDRVMFGTLMVDNKQIGLFNETDLAMVQVLAQHLSAAIENAWLYEAAQRELAEKRVLLAAGTAVSSSLDLNTVLTRLALAIGEAVDATSVYICDWHEENNQSTILAEYYSAHAAAKERVSDLGHTYFLDKDFDDDLTWLLNREPIVTHIDDVNLKVFERQHMQQYDGRSILTVPLIVKDSIVGYVELWESRQRRDFTILEIAIAQGIAQHAAIALANAQLFEAERQRRNEAELLKELARNLTSTLELDEVLQRAIEAVHQHMSNIKSCSISLLEQNNQFLRTRISWTTDLAYQIFAVGDGVYVKDTYSSRQAFETNTSLAVTNFGLIKDANEFSQALYDRGLRSILCIPLSIQERPIGLLHINIWHEPREFQPGEISFCQSVANQAAIAIHNARLFAAERQQLQFSQTLQQMGAMLTTQLDLQEVFEQIFDLLAQVIPFDTVSVQLRQENQQQFYLAAGRGIDDFFLIGKFVHDVSEQTLQRLDTPPYWTLIADTHNDDRWIRENPNLDYIRCWIGAALMVKGNIIGILNLDSRKPFAYDAKTGETVAAFANQAAVAIENARLHERTRQSAKKLAILHEVGMATAVTLDIDHLLEQTTNLISPTLYPHVFGFVLASPESDKLLPHPSIHGVPKSFLKSEIPIESSIVGKVYLTGEPFLTGDVQQEPLYLPGTPASCSEMAVPLQVHGIVIGVINVESPDNNAFGEDDLRFLSTLASQVATAIERAKLYETLQEQADVLAKRVADRTVELQTERDRTLAILENAGEGIMLTDLSANILYANPALELQSGFSRDELLGQQPSIMRSQHTPDRVMKELWETVLDGRTWSGEFTNQRKDGVEYDVSQTISPIRDVDGTISGFVSIQSDITRLKEVDRLKSQFVSNVSHELRTPLTNIKMYITLLERGRAEKHPHYLKVLNYETDRLTRLIQDLLDLSRLDTEKVEVATAVTNIHHALAEITETFRVKADAASIQFDHELKPDLPDARIHKHHFEQLITNLLGNAFAYTPENGKISVDVVENGRSHINIQISNTGPGIPPDDVPNLFERFYRGYTAREFNAPGTGLGLSICKEIVTRYGGIIQVESEPDHLTTFTVSLLTAVNAQ